MLERVAKRAGVSDVVGLGGRVPLGAFLALSVGSAVALRPAERVGVGVCSRFAQRLRCNGERSRWRIDIDRGKRVARGVCVYRGRVDECICYCDDERRAERLRCRDGGRQHLAGRDTIAARICNGPPR